MHRPLDHAPLFALDYGSLKSSLINYPDLKELFHEEKPGYLELAREIMVAAFSYFILSSVSCNCNK